VDVIPSQDNNLFAAVIEDAAGSHVLDATTGNTIDMNAVSATLAHQTRIPDILTTSSHTAFTQDLITFLQKPVVIQSGSLSGSDTFGTFPGINVPGDILNNAVYTSKVAGFLGFKADTVFRLQINGTRFQQGRYMLTFTYTGGTGPTTIHGGNWIQAHTSTLTQRTQLPKVEMDINCDTEAYLRIPFVSQYNFFPLVAKGATKTWGDIGQVRLFPYVSVTSAAATTCTYTIWAHFENIQLINPAVPQMNRDGFVTKSRKSTQEAEKDSQNVGPVTSAITKVSKAASILSGVPFISDYMLGLQWVTEGISHVTSSFGWSKPANNESTTRVLTNILPYNGNVDAVDNSQFLSFTVKNEISKLPGFSATDVDEMSLNYVASIPAWFQTLSWTTSQLSGFNIVEREVAPYRYINNRVENGVTYSDMLPCAFVASHFNLWRGSMVFTFKIVRTEFHSGRLAFAFFPHTEGFPLPARSYALSDYVHREIVDIRNHNSVTLTVPFTSAMGFKSTIDAPNVSCGTLSVYVVDPLVAPPTVSSSIQILVEVSMGQDCEFAVPRTNFFTPALNVTPQANMDFRPKPMESECSLFQSYMGGSKVTEDQMFNAMASIGEKITSFRSLIKVSEPQPLRNPNYSLYAQFLPWGANVIWNAVTPNYGTAAADTIARLTSIYALGRGSVRFKIIKNQQSATNVPILAYVCNATSLAAPSTQYYQGTLVDTAGLDNTQGRKGYPLAYAGVQKELSVEVSIPQYTQQHSRSNAEQLIAGIVQIYSFAQNAPRSVLNVTQPGTTTTMQATYLRSGGDDMNFGVFVSIPPMSQYPQVIEELRTTNSQINVNVVNPTLSVSIV
jgi:hypothetical protein